MTLSILRNTHKPTDISAFLGMLLGAQADSVCDLARILANKRNLHRIEERAQILALISETVSSVELQEMTLEAAAQHIENMVANIGNGHVDPMWVTRDFTLGKNR